MKKIMFNDRYGLTQAVIEGRKTVTRRLIPDEFFGLTWTQGATPWFMKTNTGILLMSGTRSIPAIRLAKSWPWHRAIRRLPPGIRMSIRFCPRWLKRIKYPSKAYMTLQGGITRCSPKRNLCPTKSASSESSANGCGTFRTRIASMREFLLTSMSAKAKNAIITGSMAFSMRPQDGLPEGGITLNAKPSPY